VIEIGRLLVQLGENSDALDELHAATDADGERLRSALEKSLGDLPLPPKLCNPYVRLVIAVVKPPKPVRRCIWVNQSPAPDKGQQLANAVGSGIGGDCPIELLEALGLFTCTWVRDSQPEVLIADKFIQGMCPPGTL
jgi:hypothetical protein